MLALGEIFALVVYGQLILENAEIYEIDPGIVNQIFDFMVRDFSKFALELHNKPSSSDHQMEICRRLEGAPGFFAVYDIEQLGEAVRRALAVENQPTQASDDRARLVRYLSGVVQEMQRR